MEYLIKVIGSNEYLLLVTNKHTHKVKIGNNCIYSYCDNNNISYYNYNITIQ